jgi:hypothetical protein
MPLSKIIHPLHHHRHHDHCRRRRHHHPHHHPHWFNKDLYYKSAEWRPSLTPKDS